MQLELEIGKARKQVNQNLEIITSNFAFYCELLIYIPSSVMFKYIPKYLLAGSVYGHCIRCRLYRINIRNNKSRFVILFLVLIFFKMRFSSVNFYISLICSSLRAIEKLELCGMLMHIFLVLCNDQYISGICV